MGRIVTGVDGSDGSVRALRWALTEAGSRSAEVEIVNAYSGLPYGPFPPMSDDARDQLKEAASHVVEDVMRRAGDPGEVPVRRTMVAGTAAEVLCERARDAELLVVGTRGLSAFRGILVGSVSQQVAARSPCPVVMIGPHVNTRPTENQTMATAAAP